METPVGNPNLERSAGLELEKPEVWRKTRQALRYKNRRSWRIDVFWFLELEEELGLFCRNRFYDSFAVHNSGGVLLDPTFPSSWVSSLRSCWFCLQNSKFFLADGDPHDSTPFQYITGPGPRD